MLEKIKNNLNISEEKSIKNSLLYVRNVDVNVESYETKILTEENIDNILKFQIGYEGESRVLIYDVSNSVGFEEYIKSVKLKKNDICNIVDSIDSVLGSIENYLISECSICLDLKSIRLFKDINGKIVYKFLAIPNLNSNFSYELSKFLIRILRHVDVDDKDALSLAYGLFVRSSKDNYTLSDLMELVDTVREKRVSSKDSFDPEALAAYDEELAKEVSDEIIDENKADLSLYEDTERKMQVAEVAEMDVNTKNIIEEEVFNDFDKEDKKIIKFKKKLFDFAPKKMLKGHISFDKLSMYITPLSLVAIPIVFYLLYGQDRFMKYIPIICIYEFIVLILFVLNTLKETKSGE